jgi:hypothetical protein
VRRPGLGFAVVLALAPAVAWGQGVVVAPHAVFMDHRTRSGSVLLYNPNTDPAEVTIDLFYGYPVTDSLGQIVLHTPAAPGAGDPDAAAWIQAFPRRLTVAPLERQTVRLLARPPAGLADGEYWARLVITAKGGVLPVVGVTDTAIQVGLTLEVRTIIGVNYRKGAVQTGVRVSNLRAEPAGDTVAVWARLERTGNAAFIGSVRGELVDSAGAVRGEFTWPLGVYRVLEPRFALPVNGVLGPGAYRLRVAVVSRRDDLAPEVLLQAPAVRDSIPVRVPR